MHSELSFVIGQSNAIYVYMYGFLSMSWVLSEWHSLYNIQIFFISLNEHILIKSTIYWLKGSDSNVEVKCSNFKSCYKWHNYLALNNMY